MIHCDFVKGLISLCGYLNQDSDSLMINSAALADTDEKLTVH